MSFIRHGIFGSVVMSRGVQWLVRVNFFYQIATELAMVGLINVQTKLDHQRVKTGLQLVDLD